MAKKEFNTEYFIERAKKVHGNKYDYSKVEYKMADEKVCIICPEHGEFWQAPVMHLRGQQCPKCAYKYRKRNGNKEKFLEKARKVHGDKYSYEEMNFKTSNDKIKIICPKHGEFWQVPSKHLQGRGCPKCGIEKRTEIHKVTRNTFIERALALHNGKYDYNDIHYVDMDTKINISCPKHGFFIQRPYDHLQGHGCPKCANIESKSENEIYEFCCNLLGEKNVKRNLRSLIYPQEIDIYIPSLKIGIEYNGLIWHSEKFEKDKWYHYNKMKSCAKNGIRLIQIFEDEFLDKRKIVLSKLRHLLLAESLPKIMGRKCIIKKIKKNDARDFLEKNHIQGYGSGSIYLGAFYNEILCGVMVFKKEKEGIYELNRFASDNNYICQGVGGKLFSYFIRNYNPIEIKSFADRRWTINEDNIYTKLGFIKDSELNPDYKYFRDDANIRIHKFNFRKNTLHKKYGFPLTMTESQMAKELRYYKIWDCGLIKYIWRSS